MFGGCPTKEYKTAIYNNVFKLKNGECVKANEKSKIITFLILEVFNFIVGIFFQQKKNSLSTFNI